MIGKRTSAAWRETFTREPSLSYAEAAFWIAFQDLDRMEQAFRGPNAWTKNHPE